MRVRLSVREVAKLRLNAWTDWINFPHKIHHRGQLQVFCIGWGSVFVRSRIRPPACEWSVHYLPASSRPPYVSAIIREDGHAPGRSRGAGRT